MPVAVQYQGKTITTGIFKQPVSGPLQLNETGLEGDGQFDLRNHGGVDKAVYAYPLEHYSIWQQHLGGERLHCGSFGENLTIQGLLEDQIHIGDHIAVGNTVLEVSQPRIPCYKLAMALKQPRSFVKTFSRSQRLGFYLRVLKTGQLNVNDPVEVIHRDPQGISVAEICALYFNDTENFVRIKAAVQLKPLPNNISDVFLQRLIKAGRTPPEV